MFTPGRGLPALSTVAFRLPAARSGSLVDIGLLRANRRIQVDEPQDSLAAQGGVNRVRIDLRHQGTKPLEVNEEESLVLDDGAAEAESGNFLDELRPVQSLFLVGGIVRIETWCLTWEGSASAS
jgi:hypothetical protein